MAYARSARKPVAFIASWNLSRACGIAAASARAGIVCTGATTASGEMLAKLGHSWRACSSIVRLAPMAVASLYITHAWFTMVSGSSGGHCSISAFVSSRSPISYLIAACSMITRPPSSALSATF